MGRSMSGGSPSRPLMESLEPRLLLSTVLFEDPFPSTTLDPTKWPTVDYATVDDVGINEPSPEYSLRLNGEPDGGDLIASKPIDLLLYVDAKLTYAYERTGGGETPQDNKDLIVEFWDGLDWIEADRQFGGGLDMTEYVEQSVSLPAEACHADFQFRFRNIAVDGWSGIHDDWFVDDVSLSATLDSESTPTVVGTEPVTMAAVSIGALDVDVTFSKVVTGVDATDLVLSGPGGVGATVSEPTQLGPKAWRFPISGLAEGLLHLSLAPDADDIEDPFGNDLTPATWDYEVESGSISGRKFHDVNANGIQDPGEVGLNGWTIQLLDSATGDVLAETVTSQEDLNGDGTIDSETEAGRYSFSDLPAGTHYVGEVCPDGWVQRSPRDYSLGAGPPALQVNTYTRNHRGDPAVAVSPEREFFIVWTDRYEQPASQGSGIQARLYGADGEPVTEVFQVNSESYAGTQQSPSAAWLPTGEWVVAYCSDTLNLDHRGVWFRRYGGDGQPLGADIRVDDHNDPRRVRVAPGAAGSWIITWCSQVEVGGSYSFDVYVRVYGADGLPLTDALPVNQETTGSQWQPALAADSAGNFVVAWTSANQDGEGWGIFARRVEADGTFLGDEFSVNQATEGNQQEPRIAMGNDGCFTVAWHTTEPTEGLYARSYSFDGTPLTDEFQANVSELNTWEKAYGVAYLPSGDLAFLYWTGGRGGDYPICARRFGADGSPLGDETIVLSDTEGRWGSFAFGVDAWGRIVVAAEDDGEISAKLAHGSWDDYLHTVPIGIGEDVTGRDFGNYVPADVSGQLWHDVDLQGDRDAAEPGLDGWTVELVETASGEVIDTRTTASADLNEDGVIDPAVESGLYSFEQLVPGYYTVRAVMEGGWFGVLPAGAAQSITLLSEQQIEVDFGVQPPHSEVHGQKWHDRDGDGERDADEEGLDGWTIELVDEDTNEVVSTAVTSSVDLDGDGTIDPMTESGLYSFVGFSAGEYVVREAVQPGWEQTLPGSDGDVQLTPELRAPESMHLAAGTGLAHAATCDAQGNILSVWCTYDNYLLARWHAPDGTPLTDELILWDPEGDARDCRLRIAVAPDGRFAMAWYERDFPDKYLRLFAADGTPLSDAEVVTSDYGIVDMLLDESGEGVLYLWREIDRRDHYYALHFDATGQPVGQPYPAVPLGADHEYFNGAASMHDGRVAVLSGTWEGNDCTLRVHVTRLDGTVTCGPVVIEQGVSDPRDFRIAAASEGGFIVIWPDASFRIFRADGTPRTGQIQANPEGAIENGLPSISVDDSGRFLLAWPEGDDRDGQGSGIVARWFNADGTPYGDEFVVNETYVDDQRTPTVYGTGAGEAATIVWSEYVDGWRNYIRSVLRQRAHDVSLADAQTLEGVDFANAPLPAPGCIEGRTFEDLDLSGAEDPDEPGVAGMLVHLVDTDSEVVVASGLTGDRDLNGDGAIDPLTESGLYGFDGLAAGNYEVRLMPRADWFATAPPSAVASLVLAEGQTVEDVNLGAGNCGSISGQVFEDLDGDGAFEAEDLGLDGWTVELLDGTTGAVMASQVTAPVDLDHDGEVDPRTEAGRYSFGDLQPRTYLLRVVAQDRWTQIWPGETEHSIAVGYAEDFAGVLFGQQIAPGEIHGKKWRDRDGDGVQDPDGVLGITDVTTPLHGTAVIDGTEILYTPDAGFSGVDSFRYGASDGVQIDGSAAVTVQVGDGAWAGDDVGTVPAPGSYEYDADTGIYTVSGAGRGLIGNEEGFYFVHRATLVQNNPEFAAGYKRS